jgi:hypothetical protein
VAALIATALLLTTDLVNTRHSSGEAQAAPSVASAASLGQLKKKQFYNGCKKSSKFREYRFGWNASARMTGRCLTSRVKGIRLISSYNGHHPSASRAMDVMVNLSGSCTAGRQTGNQMARYLMKNARKHNIYYIVWRNGYWNANSKPTKPRNFRQQGGGSCTSKHFDHVHVAFR